MLLCSFYVVFLHIGVIKLAQSFFRTFVTLLLHLFCERDTTAHACNKRNLVTFFLFLGVIHLSAYLKSYKVGDIVDIKVGFSI